jgi:hypothetical protein
VPIAVLAEVALSVVSKDLIPVSALLLLVSFLPLLRREIPQPRRTPAHA